MTTSESRLTEWGQESLSVARRMFMHGGIDHEGLRAHLIHNLGFSDDDAEEYVNEACDANDGDPS